MISIIIAAFNEERRLPGTLLRIVEYMNQRGTPFEIVVVDDGSSDRTAAVSNLMSVRFPTIRTISYGRNRGKGYALRTGVLSSRGESVLISDADLSTPIEEVSRLAPFLEEPGCEVVIGTRALQLSRIIRRQPWWRQGMGRIFNRIVRLFVLDGFSDTQCGFKLFRGTAARRLFDQARINRFAFDVEILALALKRGYRVVEVPITWSNSPASTVHPLRDSLLMLRDLVRIRIIMKRQQRQAPAPFLSAKAGCYSLPRGN